jgi:integrase
MTTDFISFQLKKYNLKAVNDMHPFKLCRIADSGGDMSKVWYVEYYAFDDLKKDVKRKRVVLAQETAAARYRAGKEIAKEIDGYLKAGAVTNPQNKYEAPVNSVQTSTHILKSCTYYLKFQESILKPRTHETYSTDVKRFTEFITRNSLDKYSISQITDCHANQFLDELIIKKKLTNRSRNNAKGTMSTVFNFFKKRKIITENPFDNISKLNSVATKHSALTAKQVTEFKRICLTIKENQLWLFLNMIHYCYIRPRSELRLLKIVDIKEKTILIRGENAKDNATEHVIIPSSLQDLIEENKLRSYPENHYVFGQNGEPGPEPLGRDWMYNKHRRILKLCEFENKKIDMYSWKHTGVIALFQATQNIELIRQQCRHSDISTTQKYLRDLGLFIDYEQINKFPAI